MAADESGGGMMAGIGGGAAAAADSAQQPEAAAEPSAQQPPATRHLMVDDEEAAQPSVAAPPGQASPLACWLLAPRLDAPIRYFAADQTKEYIIVCRPLSGFVNAAGTTCGRCSRVAIAAAVVGDLGRRRRQRGWRLSGPCAATRR